MLILLQTLRSKKVKCIHPEGASVLHFCEKCLFCFYKSNKYKSKICTCSICIKWDFALHAFLKQDANKKICTCTCLLLNAPLQVQVQIKSSECTCTCTYVHRYKYKSSICKKICKCITNLSRFVPHKGFFKQAPLWASANKCIRRVEQSLQSLRS